LGHITFLHAIAEPAVLLEQWRVALTDDDGVDLDNRDVTCSTVYWADLLYPNPAPAGGTNESAVLELERTTSPRDADMHWLTHVDPEQRAFVESLAREIGFEWVAPTQEQGDDGPGSGLEAVPLLPGLQRRLTRILLRDVHHYIYDEPSCPGSGGKKVRIRQEVRVRTAKALREAERGGPHLLVEHSLGSVIAYDVLPDDDDAPVIDALITIGSRLGISEVRERLAPPWTEQDGWPNKRLPTGPQSRVTDIEVTNEGPWRYAIGKYVGQELLRDRVRTVFA
jgi:hypothetical protein